MKRAVFIGMLALAVGGFARAQFPERGADSAEAEALKSFLTASGGSGMLFQYQVDYDVRIRGTERVMVDTMSSAFSDDRYTRVDMGVWGMRVAMLGHAGQPRYSVQLNMQTKSYRLNIIDTARLNRGNGQTFQVVKIGTETVAGYPCIHAKLTVIGGDKKVVMNDEIWTSTAVPAYAQFKRGMANEHITVRMMQELEKAGCDGFIVKMKGETPMTGGTAVTGDSAIRGLGSQTKFEMTLIKAERKDFPASMFEIPAGYSKSTMARVVK